MKEIPLFKVAMHPEVPADITKVIQSGLIGQYDIVDRFEEALSGRFRTKNVATTNSATSAEHLALHLFKQFGLNDGDEVLTTALSCLATNTVIPANGLKIRWVDVDPNTLNVDLDDMERKLSPRTKVLYVVHWGGYPVDLDRLKQIADKAEAMYGFRPFILEDCAHAFGSVYKGKPIGSHGNVCTFSFQAIKSLNSIDGGALVCAGHDELYRRARLQRWFGIDRDDKAKLSMRCEGDVPMWGHKFHMNDVNACVGLRNLEIVDRNIKIAKDNAAYYDAEMENMSDVDLLSREFGFDSSFWIYSLLVDRREDFMRAMKDRGIATSQVHQRNDLNSCFKEFRSSLPTLDSVINRLVHIPNGFWVDEEMREHVVSSIEKGW